MTREAELPPLSEEQLAALRSFASLEVGIEEVRRILGGLFEFDLRPDSRTASGHFRVPEPGIAITRSHLSKALEQKRLGLISERDLVYWATILLLNDAFVLDPEDEDFIAEWLNDISIHLDAT
jgi:hypothetical protein